SLAISTPAWSTAVVCKVAISCWPSVLRTISSPLDNGAYRVGRSAPGQALGNAVDGGHPGWDRGRQGSRVRGQVHAALIILRRGGGQKVHGPTAAHQWVPHLRSPPPAGPCCARTRSETDLPARPRHVSHATGAPERLHHCP